MSEGSYLTWEEVQRLALPPNAALLIPPLPEPEDVAALATRAQPPKPDWLDDGFLPAEAAQLSEPVVAIPASTSTMPTSPPVIAPGDPAAERAAAESEEYGPGPVRFLANAIAMGAVLEYATSPPKKTDEDDEEKRKLGPDPGSEPLR